MKSTTLEGKAKIKYKSDFCYELDEYHKAYKKLIELFPDGHIPKLSKLKTELEKARTDYTQQSAERTACKKEARQSKNRTAILTERTGCQEKERSA